MAEELPSGGTTQNTDTSQAAETTQQAAIETSATTALTDGKTQEASAETKVATEEGKASEDGATKDDGAKRAPEKYEFKPPEGTTLDDTVLAEFSNVAKELDLPQDQAQAMIDKLAPVIAQQQQARFDQAVLDARTAWTASVKADKEIGGDKLSENLSVAKKALDAFGTPELRTLLESTGLGDNPEIIRAFYRAGKAISEDKFVPAGNRNVTAKTDHATALYGNQSK